MSNKELDPKDIVESTDEIIETTESAADDSVVTEELPVTSTKESTVKITKSKASRRRLRYGSASFAITAIVIAAVLLLNIACSALSDRFPLTFDLSEEKIYTISDNSIKIAQSVTDVDIEVIIFTDEQYITQPSIGVSSGVPEFDTTITEFYNALKQYQSYSGGKVHFTFIDPDQDPTRFAQYSEYGVDYGSLLFLSADGRSKHLTLDDLYKIEYNQDYSYKFESYVEKVLASTINTINGAKETLIQVLVGHEEDANVIEGLQNIYSLNGYRFEDKSIVGSAEFSKDAEIMLIAAPSTDYSKEEIERIQAWMYNDGNYGHHLMVYINPVANCPNLYDFLKIDYSIAVENEIIIENDPSRMYYYKPYNTFADIPSTSFTPNSASTSKLLIPTARRLTTTLGDKDADSSYSTYALALATHPESAGVSILKEDGTSTEIKTEMDSSEYPLTSALAYVMEGHNNTTEKDTYATVMVCGSPTVAYSTYVENYVFNNEDFLLDTVRGMVNTDSAVNISTKNLSTESVVFDGSAQRILGLGVFMIGLPLLILVIGLIIFIRRIHL